jgi:regulator of protease activity HflC (stomatin/prohibitin superfamily)
MEHCVEVFDHYKTAMGYKALAHRFRLAIDLPEPFTVEDVLDALSDSIESIEAKEKAERDGRRAKVKNSGENAAAEAAAEGVAGAQETPREGAAMPIQNVIVKKACGEAGKILEMLRKGNRKSGRSVRRSMGAFDEILHGKLKLLHIPRSA